MTAPGESQATEPGAAPSAGLGAWPEARGPSPRSGSGAWPEARSAAASAGTDGWPIARVIAPYEYAPPIDGHLHALKFGRGRTLGRALALPLAAAIAAAADETDVGADVIVPVPLHRRRLAARGYNQATEIARAVAATLGVRLEPSAARRPQPSLPQSRLHAHARYANVEGAFVVRDIVCGARVAIVDDVITTGATVNAVAAAALRAGAASVQAWAVARAVPPRAGRRNQLRNT